VCELYRNGRFEDALVVFDTVPDGGKGTNLQHLRVLLLAEMGELAMARQELKRIADEPLDRYQVMRCALVARILGLNSWADELCRQIKPSSNPFEMALGEFNSNGIGADELIAAAPDDFSKCEAHFHIAHRELGNSRRCEAAKHFRAMADRNAYYYYEYRWARAFLERLEADLEWPPWILAK
jgi:lipoprotein NlpI